MSTIPDQSYVIWFSQRVGSTLLAQALEDTRIAGRPREWFTDAEGTGLLAKYNVGDAFELRRKLWNEATSPNGVLALKYGMQADEHSKVTAVLASVLTSEDATNGRGAWNAFFPGCRHVFMTRRNKVRLAVSWWRAIKTGEWHRPCRAEPAAVDRSSGQAMHPPTPPALPDAYDYDAIDHLIREAAARDADIQALLASWGVSPYTIAYEDLIVDFPATVRALLEFLEIPGGQTVPIPAPAFARIADGISEAWCERYHRDRAGK